MTHLLWFLNRGTGVVLVAVLTLSVALGVLATAPGGSRRWPRFALQSLHRNVALIACGLLLAHAITPVLDSYVSHYATLRWIDIAVPFVSAYKTLGTGLGTLALDLIAVIVVSSLARHRLKHRTWFRLHLLTYASWALGVVHGLLVGTDARTSWGLAVTAASIAVVAVALVVRLLPRRGRGAAVPGPGPLAQLETSTPAPAAAPPAGAPPTGTHSAGPLPAEHGRRRAGRRAAV